MPPRPVESKNLHGGESSDESHPNPPSLPDMGLVAARIHSLYSLRYDYAECSSDEDSLAYESEKFESQWGEGEVEREEG